MDNDKIELFRNSLIDTLKQERNKRGLSHEKISENAGVTRQTIGKIESGLTNPTMLTMYRIVNAMEMTLEEFVKKMEK